MFVAVSTSGNQMFMIKKTVQLAHYKVLRLQVAESNNHEESNRNEKDAALYNGWELQHL